MFVASSAVLVCVDRSSNLSLTVLSFQDLLHLEERLGTVNRGASQGTIERCTYPHKYKKVREWKHVRAFVCCACVCSLLYIIRPDVVDAVR